MKRDKIFLTLISSLLLSLSISLLVINKKEVSVIENRPLTSFPIFSIKNFISKVSVPGTQLINLLKFLSMKRRMIVKVMSLSNFSYHSSYFVFISW